MADTVAARLRAGAATAAVLAALAPTLAACGAGGGSPAFPPAGGTRAVGGPVPGPAAPTRVGRGPGAVTVSGGVVSVANTLDGTLDRLDAASGRPLGRPVAVGTGPLAVAGDGPAVWVARGDGALLRLDARSGRPDRRFRARLAGVSALASGEGSLWAASPPLGVLVRLDPRSGRVRGTTRIPGGPADIAIGGGSVWVSQGAPARPGATTGVVRVDPASGAIRGRTAIARNQVLALAWEGDRLWAARTDRDIGTPIDLVRLDAGGRVDGRPLRIPGRAGLRLAAGGGAVWALDGGSDLPPGPRRAPGVIRIDPRRYAIAGAPAPVGADPRGIAVGAGAVWVASAGAGSVSRLGL